MHGTCTVTRKIVSRCRINRVYHTVTKVQTVTNHSLVSLYDLCHLRACVFYLTTL